MTDIKSFITLGPDWKGLAGKNALAYFSPPSVTTNMFKSIDTSLVVDTFNSCYGEQIYEWIIDSGKGPVSKVFQDLGGKFWCPKQFFFGHVVMWRLIVGGTKVTAQLSWKKDNHPKHIFLTLFLIVCLFYQISSGLFPMVTFSAHAILKSHLHSISNTLNPFLSCSISPSLALSTEGILTEGEGSVQLTSSYNRLYIRCLKNPNTAYFL